MPGGEDRELEQSCRQMQLMAMTDPLTAIVNRRCFFDALRGQGAGAASSIRRWWTRWLPLTARNCSCFPAGGILPAGRRKLSVVINKTASS
jgi:hypothetical protein